MQGTYKITVGGKVYEYKNVITEAGQTGLLRAISGQRQGWASSIVVGVGNTAASSTDKSLEFLVTGADINASIIDPVNDKLYFKASLPLEGELIINELGCYASNSLSTQSSESGGGGILAMLTSESVWTDVSGTSITDTTHGRVGKDTIGYTLAASATGKGYLTFVKDLTFIPADANIKLAYYTTGISDFIVRFKVDDSNYYEANTWSVSNGYHIQSIAKSAFAATGSPSWASIQTLEFESIAGGSGGSVAIDAMRYELPFSEESDLLSRVAIAEPMEKIPGVSLDIEYLLEL
jgi:hypothetical protein